MRTSSIISNVVARSQAPTEGGQERGAARAVRLSRHADTPCCSPPTGSPWQQRGPVCGNEIVEPLTEVGNISDPSIGAPVSMQLPEQVKGAVRVFHGPRGRGLECVRDVKRGEVLIGISRRSGQSIPWHQRGVDLRAKLGSALSL